MKRLVGFTLVEVVVVVSVIAILAAVVFANFGEGREQSRDAQRQADLRNLQTAIELYKQENGRYPEACRGAMTWSGQKNAAYACPGGSSQYIVDLAPKYIRTLPTDPKLNGNNSGYAYLVNADGTVYKLVAFRTVETLSLVDGDDIVPELRGFQFCPVDGKEAGPNLLCNNTFAGAPFFGSTPEQCIYNDSGRIFKTSYAVWGGYADRNSDALVKRYTEEVVCQTP